MESPIIAARRRNAPADASPPGTASRRESLTRARDLAAAGLIASEFEARIARVAERYAVAVTPSMADLIARDDASDPIARQFIPDVAELDQDPGELADPIGDAAHSPLEGLVHRYPDRVLVKLASVCPVYCRFCFRREMVGQGEANLSEREFAAALDYIRAHEEIWEVVLTGGDPLTLSPRRLAQATEALAAMPHVKILRWHTRLPVAAPERVTAALAEALIGDGDKTIYVAL